MNRSFLEQLLQTLAATPQLRFVVESGDAEWSYVRVEKMPTWHSVPEEISSGAVMLAHEDVAAVAGQVLAEALCVVTPPYDDGDLRLVLEYQGYPAPVEPEQGSLVLDPSTALLAAARDVLEWETYMGGWDARCWRELRKAVRPYQEQVIPPSPGDNNHCLHAALYRRVPDGTAEGTWELVTTLRTGLSAALPLDDRAEALAELMLFCQEAWGAQPTALPDQAAQEIAAYSYDETI